MWRRALAVGFAVMLACARDGDAEQSVAAAIRARGPVPVSTSADGARVLVETPRDDGVQLDVVVRETGAVVARRDDAEPMVAPVWRGDGGAIAYFRACGHRRAYDVRIWELGGGDRSLGLPLTATAFARLAPDGARVAYVASELGGPRVLTVASIAPLRAAIAVAPRALLRIAERVEAEWSPDGRRIATASAAAPGALTVVSVAGGAAITVPVIAGELRDLAWSPDGRVVVVTGRAAGAAWLRAYRVRLADGAVEQLAAPDGDCHAPRFVGDTPAFHVERDGERRIYLSEAAGPRAIGPADASARLLGIAGDSVIAQVRDRVRASYLADVRWPASRDGGSDRQAPTLAATAALPARAITAEAGLQARATTARGPGAIRVAVPAPDGTALPAFLWRARAATGAVVIVHGGPALHAVPAWNEKTQLLVDAGLDVVKLDYRGSTGYGAGFEALDASDPLRARVADVIAARDWTIRTLGHAADRVIVLGESYGAGLVAAAAATGALAGPIVLVATQPLSPRGDPPGHAPRRCPVVAFHGADDDISPFAPARVHLAGLFGHALRWRLLLDEGHNLGRVASWASVYAALLALRVSPCR